jgi:YVTN family beta-propeller protein
MRLRARCNRGIRYPKILFIAVVCAIAAPALSGTSLPAGPGTGPGGSVHHVSPQGTGLGSPYVSNSLVLANNTLLPGNFAAENELDPGLVAYDSGKGELFVGSGISDNVSVISDATDTISAMIHLSTPVGALAYDSGKGEIFAPSDGGDTVTVISDATNHVVATVTVGGDPDGAAYDVGKGEVFVANSLPDSVSVISDTSNAVVATVHVGLDPGGMVYDGGTGEVFVGNSQSSNVSVISDSTNHVIATVPEGLAPLGFAYDSAKGEIFVANSATSSSNVSVISDSTDRVVATLEAGSNPWNVGYDGSKGEIFVDNWGSDNVSVFSDSTDKVVATIPVQSYPEGAAFDSAKGEFFVSNYLSDTVSIISDATNHLLTDLAVGSEPEAMAYDAGKAEIFVVNDGSQNVVIVSDVSQRVVATVVVGSNPDALVYDGSKGEVFVANEYSNSVSVISDTTNSVVATVGVGSYPDALAYDSAKGQVFVANLDWNDVSVISDNNDQVVSTIGVYSGPAGLAYDSGRGEVFVTNQGSDIVSVISDSTDTVVSTVMVGTLPTAVTYDSAMNEVFVSNHWSSNLSVISDVSNRVVASIPVGSEPGTTAYDAMLGELFVSNTGSNNLSLVSGTTDHVTWTGSIGTVPGSVVYDSATGSLDLSNPQGGTLSFFSAGTYGLTFEETGLAAGTIWAITLNGSQQSSTANWITFSEPNGSYALAVASVPGYVTGSAPSTIQVTGAPTNLTITFALPPKYAVTFDENGLPSGANWYVNVTSGPALTTTGATTGLSSNLANGTYEFTVATSDKLYAASYTPAVTVSGAPTSVDAVFSPFTYSVAFSQSGLPSGQTWYVNISAGASLRGTGGVTTLSANMTNGTYHFSGATNDKLYAPSYTAIFAVHGVALSNPVGFSLFSYSAKFTQSGLPASAKWYINITGGPSLSGPGSTGNLFANLVNGTYSLSIATNNKTYIPTYSPMVTVSGGMVQIAATFSIVSYSVMFSETGLPVSSTWYVNVTVGPSLSASGATTHLSTALENGTYGFAVATSSKTYAPSYSSGFSVVGGSAFVVVTFSPVEFPVTFTQSGLPASDLWYVNITGGPTLSASGGTTILSAELLNGTYAFTVASNNKTYAPSYTPILSVVGGSASASLEFARFAYQVSIVATGLPAGTNWSVTFALQAKWSLGGMITFQRSNGTTIYHVASSDTRYAGTYSPSLIVAGTPVSLTIPFTPFTYAVSVTETGLPTPDTWYANATGASPRSATGATTTLTLDLLNGTHIWSMATNDKDYAPSYSPSMAVSGSPITENLTFTPYTTAVTFTESGLPNGLTWYANITDGISEMATTSASGGHDVSIDMTNGTYSFRAAVDSSQWAPSYTPRVSVSTGSGPMPTPVSVQVPFDQFTFAATFVESGLAIGSSWSVTCGTVELSSTTTAITFAEGNGTIPYTIHIPAGWGLPTGGTTGFITVDGGSPAPIDVAFDPLFTVTFSETGLTYGTNWSVTIGSMTMEETGNSTALSLVDGAYTYSVATTSDLFRPVPAEGNFSVNGAGLNEVIVFQPVVYAVIFEESGLPSGTNWSVTITGTASTQVLLGALEGASPASVTQWSHGASSIRVYLANGTYSYSTTAAGHEMAASELTVKGPGSAPVAVGFPSTAGSSSEYPLIALRVIGLVILGAIAASVGVMRRRRTSVRPDEAGPGAPATRVAAAPALPTSALQAAPRVEPVPEYLELPTDVGYS